MTTIRSRCAVPRALRSAPVAVRARRRLWRAAAGLVVCYALAPRRSPAAMRPPGWLDGGAQGALRVLARAAAIVEGQAGPELEVFFDLRCPACLLLYRASRAPVQAGRLRLRWLPVAILGPESLEAGARLLAARDPRGALARAWASSGSVPAAQYRPPRRAAAQRAVLANTQLLRSAARAEARTPSWVQIQADGRVALGVGISPDLLRQLRLVR